VLAAEPAGPVVWSAPEDCYGLYDVDVAAAAARRLSDQHVEQPVWSSDGSRIAFLRRDPQDQWGSPSVVVVNADGSGARTVRSGDATQYYNLQWVADSHVLFMTESHVNDQEPPDQVVLFDTDDGSTRAFRPEGAQSYEHISEAVVSPAGDRIVYGETSIKVAPRLLGAVSQPWMVAAPEGAVRSHGVAGLPARDRECQLPGATVRRGSAGGCDERGRRRSPARRPGAGAP